jgi:hypothetical protein
MTKSTKKAGEMSLRFTWPILLAAALVLAATPAHAQATDPAAAQALFDQGRAELACAKLEESQRLAPATGTAFNLADCYEHIGRLASAWSLFRDVATAAARAGQTERARVASMRADALEKTLPRLFVQVLAAPDLDVQRDGVSIGRAQWNTAIPVDLGQHVVTATAPHKTAWRGAVVVSRRGETVTISVPALEDGGSGTATATARPAPAAAPAENRAPVAPAAPPVAAGQPPPPTVTPTEPLPASGGTPALARDESPTRIAPIILGTGGLGMLVASGVTIAVARSMYRNAGPCDGSNCSTTQAVSERNSARNWGNLATALGIIGGVGVSAAVVLWWIAPRPVDPSPAPSPSVLVHRRSTWDVIVRGDGVQLRGAW